MHQHEQFNLSSELTVCYYRCHCYANNLSTWKRHTHTQTNPPRHMIQQYNCIWIELPPKKSNEIDSIIYNFINVFMLSWHNRSLTWFRLLFVPWLGFPMRSNGMGIETKIFRPVQLHWLKVGGEELGIMAGKWRENGKSLFTGIGRLGCYHDNLEPRHQIHQCTM